MRKARLRGAASGWLVLTFFMEHWQPRINAAIHLAVAGALRERRREVKDTVARDAGRST